jgi:Protein of unknown function (DUF993)
MSLTLSLPAEGGRPTRYTMRETPVRIPLGPHKHSRVAFCAAHVVADPFSDTEPSEDAAIDWDKTIAFRRRLLDLGLGIAEAMDTAQRGFGLNWKSALELIRRSLDAASLEERDRIFSGVGTDHLSAAGARTLDDVVRAYGEQIEAVQRVGGRMIFMASRALAQVATNADDYRYVYNKAIGMAEKPVILHWLGEMFDPGLKGYWGAHDFEETLETALAVIHDNKAKVDGIKISLLDAQKEIDMRRRLPAGVKMYTGDDFNYPELIKGDAHGYSHALLGIFDPIAIAASAALGALARGDIAAYDRLMNPTVPLGRLIFRGPTQFYKTGVVFLAYLNGHQDHFVMLGGAQSMRPLPYFVDVFRLADAADLLENPDQALGRMKSFLTMYGFEQ